MLNWKVRQWNVFSWPSVNFHLQSDTTLPDKTLNRKHTKVIKPEKEPPPPLPPIKYIHCKEKLTTSSSQMCSISKTLTPTLQDRSKIISDFPSRNDDKFLIRLSLLDDWQSPKLKYVRWMLYNMAQQDND